jgi:phosphate starvation-inducible PhoH-like protein
VTVEADDLVPLFGAHDENLRTIEESLGVRASARGNVVHFEGERRQVERAEQILTQLTEIQAELRALKPEEVRAACRLVAENPGYELRAFFLDGTVRVTPSRTVTPKSFNQKLYVETIRLKDLVFGIGPAGTGKTYLAIAMAVQALTERRTRRIILARPAVEAGEKLGFLPGDLAEKVNPYLRPLYDALHDMLDPEVVARYLAKGIIEVAPIAFMRGRTLNDSFVILDEAQNTTSEQMKMFLTRIGFNSKAVVTGDVTQVDLPPGTVSGLREARAIMGDIAGIGFVHFDERDVVRHPLVQSIIRAYERHASGRGSGQPG